MTVDLGPPSAIQLRHSRREADPCAEGTGCELLTRDLIQVQKMKTQVHHCHSQLRGAVDGGLRRDLPFFDTFVSSIGKVAR